MTDSRTDNGMLTDKEIENMLSIITSSGVTDDFDEQHYFPTKYLDSVHAKLKNFCKNLSQFYSFHLQSSCNFSVNTVYETNYESYLRSIPSKTFAFSTTWNNSMLMVETGGEFARMIIHKETYSFLQAQKQNFSDEDCNVINSLIRELVPVSKTFSQNEFILAQERVVLPFVQLLQKSITNNFIDIRLSEMGNFTSYMKGICNTENCIMACIEYKANDEFGMINVCFPSSFVKKFF